MLLDLSMDLRKNHSAIAGFYYVIPHYTFRFSKDIFPIYPVLNKNGEQISGSNHQDITDTVHQHGVQNAAAFLIYIPNQDAHDKSINQPKDNQFRNRKRRDGICNMCCSEQQINQHNLQGNASDLGCFLSKSKEETRIFISCIPQKQLPSMSLRFT